MAFFAGFAGGFNTAMTQDRHLQAQLDEARATRENAALQHLSTSDDPEIASMALTGLLNQSRKPSKGLRGFFNETEGNPMLPTIRELMAKGKQVPNQGAPTPNAPPTTADFGGPPDASGSSIHAIPPNLAASPEDQPQSAALPAGAATEAGAKPLSPSAGGPPGPVQFHEGPSVGTHTVPRPAFLSPGERAGAIEAAQLGAKYKAELAAYVDAQRIPGAAQALFPATVRTSGVHYGPPDDYGGQTVTDFAGNVVGYVPGGKTARPTAQAAALEQDLANYKTAHAGVSDADALTAVRTAREGVTENKAALGAAQLTNATTARAVPVPVTKADGSTEIQFVNPPYAPRSGVAAAPPPTAGVGTAATPAAQGAGTKGPSAPPKRGGIQTKPATVTPETTIYFADQLIRDPMNLKLIAGDKIQMTAVRKELASRGIDLNNLDAASRTMANTAKDIQKVLPSIETQAKELDRLGLMGPMGGRWRELIAGKIGSGEVAGGNAENAAKIGRFITDTELLKTALMKAHTGARGSSQLLEEFNNTLGAGWRDLPTFLGGLKGVGDWIDVYANRIPDTQKGGGTVKMRAPDGRSLSVPASEVERLKGLGAVVVQ